MPSARGSDPVNRKVDLLTEMQWRLLTRLDLGTVEAAPSLALRLGCGGGHRPTKRRLRANPVQGG